MTRSPSLVIPGESQHVIVRGNNRDPIVYADEDYHFGFTLRMIFMSRWVPTGELSIRVQRD